jgi:hypothetical protein
MHIHHISMSISKRLNQLDLKVYKVGHQKCLAVDGEIISH